MKKKYFLLSFVMACAFLRTATGTAQTPASKYAGAKQKESAGDADLNTKSVKVYRLGDPGVTGPKGLYTPEPEYSDAARRNLLEGKVGLDVVIDNKGRVGYVKVRKPLGMGLDENAVNTVKQWRFTPAMKDGAPVPI